MNIGQAVEITGLTAKAIRHYEALGLVIPERRDNDYRDYSEQNLNQLRFLRGVRSVGFGLAEAKLLLELYRNPERLGLDVKPILLQKLAQLDEQGQILDQVRETLTSMVQVCAGDDSSNPAILNRPEEGISHLSFRLVD